MKKTILAILLSLSSVAFADPNLTTPELHKIKRFVLSAPYSCGGSYEKSALFLSQYSKERNSPDLLYNGGCNWSENYVEASTAGDDFSVIADLGNVPLEKVSASKSFNLENTYGKENVFKVRQTLQPDHTYAVLISKSEIRSLYVFKVVSYTLGGSMTIDVAVKSYSIQNTLSRSEGFDWESGNQKNECSK